MISTSYIRIHGSHIFFGQVAAKIFLPKNQNIPCNIRTLANIKSWITSAVSTTTLAYIFSYTG